MEVITQTKAEKKARKACAALNLKELPGVQRVTMKKQPNILFVIDKPEVYRSGNDGSKDEVFVVYGVAHIDEAGSGGKGAAAQQFAQASAADDDEDDMPGLENKTASAPKAAAGASGAGDKAAGGQSKYAEKDIEMIMSQASVDRAAAVAALAKNDGDVVNTIMDLTM